MKPWIIEDRRAGYRWGAVSDHPQSFYGVFFYRPLLGLAPAPMNMRGLDRNIFDKLELDRAMDAARGTKGGRLMSRGAHKLKQGDITKAIKGAANAGLSVKRVEIQDGKIIVFAGRPDDMAQTNEWDEVQ